MTLKKRSTFESVLITVIVVLTLALGIALFAGRTKVQNGRLLIQELSSLRSGVSLYRAVNGRMPETLIELVNSAYKMGESERPYLEFKYKDEQGAITDPFGNPFHYDFKSGWVSSTTNGYESW